MKNEIIKRKKEELDEYKNIKKNAKKKIEKHMLILFIVGLVVLLVYFVGMKLVESNEDIEAKIVGEKYSVNWSNSLTNIEDSENFKKFKKVLKDNAKKFDKTIVIFNQFSGCESCIDNLCEGLNPKVKKLNEKNIGIVLITTLEKDYIDAMYDNKKQELDIMSDSDFSISRNLDIYNEEYNQVENNILVIEKENIESCLDEYYYEDDEDIVKYIESYIE